MRKLQLYMWTGIRGQILARHDFYIEQITKRVLSHFRDIEEQAESYANSEYERLGSLPARDDIDMGDFAEWANDRGQERYGLLSDLKTQMILGALAGIFHQWDKDLRDFVERELIHDLKAETASKIAWNPNIGNVFDVLQQFGWDCRSRPFFLGIDACRLIVNVFKHGKGVSLESLAKRYPEYLKGPFGVYNVESRHSLKDLDHEMLFVSEEQFTNLSADVRQFWTEFPERLFMALE